MNGASVPYLEVAIKGGGQWEPEAAVAPPMGAPPLTINNVTSNDVTRRLDLETVSGRF